MKLSSIIRSLVVVGVVLALAFSAAAQTSNGTISGSVADASGAAVTTATVTAKSVQTGDTRTVTTTSIGTYRLESLIPGTYTLTVTAPGFSKSEVKNVQVTGSVVTSLNVDLKIGTTEVVSVEANAETLQTESGEISSTISSVEVSELPISNLNPYSLAVTLPGVTTVTTADFTNGTSFSVNGTRPRSNNFLIEGQDNNDAGIHGQGLQPQNLDAIKEVTFLANSYSAEFGHGGGSVSNIIYKNGGNQFHGSAWDLLQNSALDANDHGNNLYETPKTKYRENVFGFTFGGPVKKDKLFFFVSHQWDKYRATANTGTNLIPTEAGVAALQSLPANTRVTNLLAAIGSLRGNVNSPNHQFMQLGGGRPAIEVGDIARTGIGQQSESPEFDVKGDWMISKSDTLNLRYIRTSYSTPYDFWNNAYQLPGFDTNQNGASHNAGLTYTHVFSNSLINEFRTSYGRIGFNFGLRPDTLSNPLGTFPTTSISGMLSYGAPSGMPQGRFHNTYQFQDSLSWQKGTHFFKFGADMADIRVVDKVPFNFYGAMGYSGGGGYSALANYIDDYSGTSTVAVSHAWGNPTVRPQMLSQNYFFQDTWKIKPNFTLIYGVRYEYNGAPANSLPFPAIDPENMFPSCYSAMIAAQSAAIKNGTTPSTDCRFPQIPDKEAWGPRVSFAYTPRWGQKLFGDNKTVIRGGFGTYYDGIFTNIVDNTQAAAPNAISRSYTNRTTAGRGTSNWTGRFNGLAQTISMFDTQTSMVQHLLSPRILQWNLNVQRELPNNFSLTVGYVGTRGEHLFATSSRNPLTPDTGNYRNPTRGSLTIRDNSGDSIYHGMDVELDRKFSKGLLFRAAYTYSKSIDDVSEVFTTGNWSTYSTVQYPQNRGVTERALSAFDHRQRLALSYVYQIPNIRKGDSLKLLGYIFNDWQISGTTAFQSGNPATVTVGYDVNYDGISNDRPNIGNPLAPMASYGWDGSWDVGVPAGQVCKGPEWWVGPCEPVSASTVRWIVPAFGTQGNAGRNSIMTPGIQSWNFSVSRKVKIAEKHNLEFRTDFYNLFNHANTGTPNFTLITGIPVSGKSTFGDYASSISGNRNIRLWLKYSF